MDRAGDELLAGAGLAVDEHGDVGARDLLHAVVDLDHLRARADDLAEPHVLEALGQLGLLGAQLVEQLRVLDEQRRLGREDGEHLELLGAEQIADVVVAHVDEPEQLAADQERHRHHAAELEVHDREAAAEALVGVRVGDDLRLARGDGLANDVVRQQLRGVVDRLALEVAGHADRIAGAVGRAVGQHEEALARLRHRHHLVDELVEQRLEVGGPGQERRELLELPHGLERHRGARVVLGPRLALGDRVDRREHQLVAAHHHHVAVAQLVAAGLLAAHEERGAALRRLEHVAAGLVDEGAVGGRDLGPLQHQVALG